MNALAQVEREVIESPRATGSLTKSGTDAAALIQAISAAAANPQTDIEKMERLWAMHERIVARDAEQAFNESMGAAQGDMGRISADATNKQTHSKYATYGQLDRHVRPVYTAHGFSLSFDTADGAPEGCLRVLAYVSHKAGHTRTYRADVPSDGKGAKGGDVMTKTHATGSAMSYGMRYLLKMIFNIAIGEDDDDGNAAGGNYPEPQQQQRQDASGRPVWPDESFNTQYARWTKAVEQGLKTVADIEAMATAKGALTADQANRIKQLAARAPSTASGAR